MRLPVLLRLAVTGGRLDVLRIVLTAFGAVLATLLLLAAATVGAVSGDGGYTNGLLAEAGLRPGVMVTLLLVGLPVLFFVGQCVRVGAPARDRRLAEYRMTGATPGQAVQVAATETGVAAAVGTAIGFALYLLGRVLLDRPEPPRPLPTDVLPTWWAMLLVALVVPLGGAALAALALRGSAITPFGVVRQRPARPPRALPAVLFFGGSIGLALISGLAYWLGPEWSFRELALLEFAFILSALLGLVTGGASVSAAIGGRIASRAKSPALLLAGRRLVADPWAASRTLAALLAAVLLGAGAMTTGAAWAAEREAQSDLLRQAGDAGLQSPPDPFYDRAFTLVQYAVWAAILVAAGGLLVATVEQVLERRRTLAALSAQGTPTGVLARALLWQTALPLVPGVLLASAVGAIAARGIFASSTTYTQEIDDRVITVELHDTVPWGGLTGLAVGTVLVTLAFCGVGLLALRRATAIDEIRTT